MAWVNVSNVAVKGLNPAPLNTDFVFEVSFQCLEDLGLPLIWKLIYVGCADDKTKDQELERIEIGPLRRGALKFTLEADPPNFQLIDPDDIWGSTVILLEASYRDQDFIRIGWYIHNVYVDPQLQDDPPDVPILEKMVRYIVVDEPRVTRFNINWTGAAVTSVENPPIEMTGYSSIEGQQQHLPTALSSQQQLSQTNITEAQNGLAAAVNNQGGFVGQQQSGSCQMLQQQLPIPAVMPAYGMVSLGDDGMMGD